VLATTRAVAETISHVHGWQFGVTTASTPALNGGTGEALLSAVQA
jgi:hypothetical protein